jgi:CBS domain-containing protein
MLRLRDIMTKDVLTVTRDMPMRDAMALLARRHVSGAPVIDRGQVVGVVSSTDLLEFAGHEWTALEEHTVADAMTPTVVSLPPGTPVQVAADLMRTVGVHRVLVMHGNRLVGIVTTTDITNAVADDKLTTRQYVSPPKAEDEAPGWR